MRAPFGSESEGFEFLLLTVGAFAAIVVASVLGGPRAGIPAWGVVTAAAVVLYLRREERTPERATSPVRADDAERHVLVLALEPPGDDAVAAVRHSALLGPMHAHVVCPAHVSALRHWTSDVDRGTREAARTLEQSLDLLRAAGIAASGEVGDEDAVRSIEDAQRTFGADQIVVVSAFGAPGREIAASVRDRFAVPVRHVEAFVVSDDLEPAAPPTTGGQRRAGSRSS